MVKIIAFSLDKKHEIPQVEIPAEIKIEQWHPSFTKPIPPLSSITYIVFYFFHIISIFKNKRYGAFILKDKRSNKILSQIVCIPACFRWSFMEKEDIQIKDVLTLPSYRGNGFANILLQHIINNYAKENYKIWYMTSENNIASIKLAKKNGFVKKGIYSLERKGIVSKGKII